MKKLFLPIVIAALGAVACTHQEPTDAQLTALLHSENGPPAQTIRRLDAGAVACLRSWSGDTELITGLALGVTTADGKKACRVRIDNWLTDAARNPDRLAFDDLTPVPVVRRVLALQKSAFSGALGNPSQRMPPAALQRSTAAQLPSAPVDLGPTGQHLERAEAACQRLQAAADGGNTDIRIKRYSKMCAPNLKTLRANMERVAGTAPEQLPAYATSADNIANAAQNMLDKAGVK